MPTYRGEEVGQEFIDHILYTYKAQYEAADEAHQAPASDDTTLLARMESQNVTGGPEACALARADAVLVQPLAAQGTASVKNHRKGRD